MTNYRPQMSDQDKKLLWGKAGNRCAICKKLLVNIEDGDERGVIVGIESHIVAHSEDGPRGKDLLPLSERHKYENIILLCTEHAKTIDERPEVWTTGRLRQVKKDHEKLMMSITPAIEHPHPVLRLVQPVGYTGGSQGHFQTLRLKNFDKEAALDLKCWMQGFGFYHELKSRTAETHLDPGKEKDYQFQLDGLKIEHEDIPLFYFFASYNTLEGQKILYKSSLIQVTVPSGTFKKVDLGDENEYSKSAVKSYVDYMLVLESSGDYRKAEYSVGDHKFKIKVSRSLLSTWDIASSENIQYCFLELGRANMNIMTKLNAFQDKEYHTDSFPETYATGFERFAEALKLIESGSY